jgi:hypothetical protein
VVAHAELSGDLDLPERPGHEGADGADGDELPQAALRQGGEAETVAEIRRLMLICQTFQVGPMAAPQRMSAVPSAAKKIVVTPKKPT